MQVAPTSLLFRTIAPMQPVEVPGDDGWLGQTPPPSPPAAGCGCPDGATPPYANPGIAPDPWITPPPLFPDDPTLFG